MRKQDTDVAIVDVEEFGGRSTLAQSSVSVHKIRSWRNCIKPRVGQKQDS